MQSTRLPDPIVELDGRRVWASTELAYAGAYQLTLSTALPALGVELHSSYLGHPGAHESITSHLQLAPDLTPQTWVEHHAAADLPVSAARRRCLYDHLLELQQLLAETSAGEVTVELTDAALELVDAA